MKFHKKKYKSKEKQASEISHTTLPRLKSRVRIPNTLNPPSKEQPHNHKRSRQLNSDEKTFKNKKGKR